MSLVYRFKKEKLLDGRYVLRPRILVVLSGKDNSIEVPALVDSGCDTTVIPEGIAKAIGLEIKGEKTKIYAYRECTDVIEGAANITFLGKASRESVKLNLHVLIALPRKGFEDEEDITLGVNGIFDAFDITFKKSVNKIILKKVNAISKFLFS